jgi:glucan 1,3-beta-glucosidase
MGKLTTRPRFKMSSGTAAGKVVFVDAGTYKLTRTVYIPAGSKIVGESYSVIMSSGSFFADINNPQPVVQVGHPGESGQIEWSDMIVSTQGEQSGAVLIQWNLASSSSMPSGMWDVHTRIGGFAGSDLQLAQCPTTPHVATPPATVNNNCIAAFLSMHVTPSATGLYMENVWLWTADHDVEDANLTQITVYTGRGLHVESKEGVLWLYGTAVEHHSKYQYHSRTRKPSLWGRFKPRLLTISMMPKTSCNLIDKL